MLNRTFDSLRRMSRSSAGSTPGPRRVRLVVLPDRRPYGDGHFRAGLQVRLGFIVLFAAAAPSRPSSSPR